MKDKVQVYSKQNLQDRVSEAVRTQIGMLIPKDDFAAMVAKETKAFFETEVKHVFYESSSGSNWNGDRKHKQGICSNITPFRAMVWIEVDKIMRAKLTELLGAPRFKDQNGFATTDAALTKYLEGQLKTFAPIAINAWMEQLLGLTADAVHQSLGNKLDSIRSSY